MIRFDPSPWLLFAIPFLGIVTYICYRGLSRNEFRERGRWGWFTYPTGSLDWYLGTLGNLLFLGSGLLILYYAAFKGTSF